MSGLFLLYIFVACLIKPELGPPLPKEERNVPWSRILWEVTVSSVPIGILTVVVLWIIIIGWTTATEAAALGALMAFMIAAGYGKLNWQMVKESVRLTGRTTAMVCWLFVGASLFAAVFARLGAQAQLEQWVLGLGLGSNGFLWVAMLVIFLLGWPLEWTEIIVIFIPIFLPLLKTFQIDPLIFGVMVAVNLPTSCLSLPVARATFYLKGIAPPHVTLNQLYRGMYPFLAIQLVTQCHLWHSAHMNSIACRTLCLRRMVYASCP